MTMHLKVGKIFFAKTYLRVLKHEKNIFREKVEKFFDIENFWPQLELLYRNETLSL